MIEIWKDIEGYEGLYQISSEGRVKSLYFGKEKIKKIQTDKDGYKCCGLNFNKFTKNAKVHRLVAEAFITNKLNKPIINHINGIKSDNRIENLEWVTTSENHKHAYDKLNRTRIHPNHKGELNPRSKLTNGDILKIRNDNRIHKKIAEDYGVSRSCITMIKNYKSYV